LAARGSEYVPGRIQKALSSIIFMIGILAIGLSLAIDLIPGVPQVVRDFVVQYKFAGPITFFVCNQVSNALASSGAFEVYYGGHLIHSKLQTGEVPDLTTVTRSLLQLGARPDVGLIERVFGAEAPRLLAAAAVKEATS
jgi:Rdx family